MNIKRALRKLGVIKAKPLVNPNGRPKKTVYDAAIQSLKGEGFSNCEIARRLGVSEGTIRNRLRKGFDK